MSIQAFSHRFTLAINNHSSHVAAEKKIANSKFIGKFWVCPEHWFCPKHQEGCVYFDFEYPKVHGACLPSRESKEQNYFGLRDSSNNFRKFPVDLGFIYAISVQGQEVILSKKEQISCQDLSKRCQKIH